MSTEADVGEEAQQTFKEAVMPLGDHLEELRSRIIKAVVAVAVVFIGCWFFRLTILDIVMRPHILATAAANVASTLKQQSYPEALIAQLKACLIVAAVITSPWLIYQAWAFVAPGLYPKERRKAIKMVLPSVICLLAGVAFGYFFAIPMALRFLLRMSGPRVEPVLMIGSYMSLFFLLTLALGVAFQTPVVIFYLVRWDIVDSSTLQENRKIAIMVAFVLSAFFTPPDFITQAMMAIPLVLLYDLGVVAGHPSRETLLSFSKFFGVIVLVGALLAGWFYYWPVAEIEAVKGEVTVAESRVEKKTSRRVRRGQLCEVGEDGGARLKLGGGEDDPQVLISGKCRLQVHSSSSLTLLEGRILALEPTEDGALNIKHAIANSVVNSGKAELRAVPDEHIKVTVIEGQVTVTKGKEEPVKIQAGHTKTFRKGGEPTEDEELGKEWRELMEPDGEEEAEQGPETEKGEAAGDGGDGQETDDSGGQSGR